MQRRPVRRKVFHRVLNVHEMDTQHFMGFCNACQLKIALIKMIAGIIPYHRQFVLITKARWFQAWSVVLIQQGHHYGVGIFPLFHMTKSNMWNLFKIDCIPSVCAADPIRYCFRMHLNKYKKKHTHTKQKLKAAQMHFSELGVYGVYMLVLSCRQCFFFFLMPGNSFHGNQGLGKSHTDVADLARWAAGADVESSELGWQQYTLLPAVTDEGNSRKIQIVLASAGQLFCCVLIILSSRPPYRGFWAVG